MIALYPLLSSIKNMIRIKDKNHHTTSSSDSQYQMSLLFLSYLYLILPYLIWERLMSKMGEGDEVWQCTAASFLSHCIAHQIAQIWNKTFYWTFPLILSAYHIIFSYDILIFSYPIIPSVIRFLKFRRRKKYDIEHFPYLNIILSYKI